ncbi:MAG TPA: hypothetical protein VET90_06985, partial [Candidatus Binatus sp.]|nr:hypothetical protein [Candidatus Binatus sp.]
AGIRWSGAVPAAAPQLLDRGSITIEQSALKQYGGVVFGFSGGLIFLVAGLLFGGESLLALVGFCFFGVFMLLGGVVSLRRGGDLRLIEVGPDGLWLPEMGRLGWPEIRVVRLEVMRGVGSGDRLVPYRRLGVEPMDPEIRPSIATSIGWRMLDGYSRMLKSLAPGSRVGRQDRSPFGFGEPEASRAQVDAVLAVLRRYAEVVDAAEERARQHAPRWALRSDEGAANPVDLRTVDAALAPGTRPEAAGGSLVAVASARPPAATFRTPPLSVGAVWRWALAIVPVVSFGLVALSVHGATDVGVVALVLLGVAAILLGPQVVRFGPRWLERLRRSRLPPEERTVLRVGPDGIWLPGMGDVPWDRVATVTAKVAGQSPLGIAGQIPRWALFVEPEPEGGAAGRWVVYADQLDAPFDDVVDLVRYYHPVVEVG